ncbi:hypothetical protein DPMN_108281 [Dreissena polymorpha]|uniref:Uncharacterized protein n=1 Tax=Dreissena polymorpha TaxID=45954 RepID=A0A9D4K8H6_DREPO|nr:hypothetical protein DPMN_108281 [Dreissena polymorpha]
MKFLEVARQRPTRIPTPHRCYIKNQFWVVKAYVVGASGWVMWTWMVEIDRVAIRDKRPRIDRIVINEVQYQLKVNRCRNEEVIVKGNFEWMWPMWAGPWIERVVIRDQNFGRAWSMWAGRPRLSSIVEVDRIVIRDVQYQFEVNRCRNEELNFQGSSANSDERTDGQTAEITT